MERSRATRDLTRRRRNDDGARIERDGSEERSVLWILDRVYSEREADPALERAKQDARDDVYASQFVDFGTKYFGHASNANSRRCYLKAIQHDRKRLRDPRILRQLAATFIPRGVYDGAKRMLGRRPA